MLEFLSSLFNSEPFMPHGQCFLWYPEVLWLHVISDAIIALAYFSIPITIALLLRKQKDIPFRWMYVMFAGFILFCGMTHVMDIIVFWDPLYRLQGILLAFTGAVSIATALMIVPFIPQIASALKTHRPHPSDSDKTDTSS